MVYLIQIIRLFKENTEYNAQEFIEYLDNVYGIGIPEAESKRYIQYIYSSISQNS